MAFKARFPGTCAKCQGPIARGQEITWSRRVTGPRGGKTLYHLYCAKDAGIPDETGPEEIPAPVPAPKEKKSHNTFEVASSVVALGETLENFNRRLEQVEESVTSPDSAPDVDEEKVRELIAKAVAEVSRPTLIILQDRNGQKVEVEGVQHNLFPRLLYHIQLGEHVYLYGPSQSGKSTAAHNAAKALGRRYGYISLNPQTPDSRLLGFIDANGVYRETEFYRCYSQGGIYCIDEVDNASSSLLTTLNSSHANGMGAFPCGMVERHKDYTCVATGNTPGRGGTPQYPERRNLDGAFRERFTFLEWGYDEALEEALVLGINDKAMPLLKWYRKVRAYTQAQGISVMATPTGAMKLARYALDKTVPFDAAIDACLFKGIGEDVKERILAGVSPNTEGVAW